MKIVKSIVQNETEIFENDLVTYTENCYGNVQKKISGRLSNIFLAKGYKRYIVGGFIIDQSTEYNSNTATIIINNRTPEDVILYKGIYPISGCINCKEIEYKLYYCDNIDKCIRPLPIGKKVDIALKSGKYITGILKDIEDPQCKYISIDASSEYESKIKKIKVKKIKTIYK